MGYLKKIILHVFLTGLWINFSESVRWVLAAKSYWDEKYQSMGLVFLEEPINLAVWMTWGFLFAAIIFVLSKKFSLVQTALMSWFVVFVMLWIVLWNVGILPAGMLWIVAPLSLLEAFVGAFICKKFSAEQQI